MHGAVCAERDANAAHLKPRSSILPSQNGLLVELAAFDEAAAADAARAGLEDVRVEPLAFEETLKILLRGGE